MFLDVGEHRGGSGSEPVIARRKYRQESGLGRGGRRHLGVGGLPQTFADAPSEAGQERAAERSGA